MGIYNWHNMVYILKKKKKKEKKKEKNMVHFVSIFGNL